MESLMLPDEMEAEKNRKIILTQANKISILEKNIYDIYVKRLERLLIQLSIDHCKGKKINAASLLGIGRNTITRKINELDI